MRIRISFSKKGPMQYVGHLDLHRCWERAFRRSGLPLAYSLGFHPQPRLNIACALPVGFTSQCELLDAWLEQEFAVNSLKVPLSNSLPPGLSIESICQVDERAPALQTQIRSAVYSITFLDEISDLSERVAQVLSASELIRHRRDKTYDMRPLVERIEILPPGEDNHARILAQLSVREAATGRPEELLAEMGIKFEDTRVLRQELIFAS